MIYAKNMTFIPFKQHCICSVVTVLNADNLYLLFTILQKIKEICEYIADKDACFGS